MTILGALRPAVAGAVLLGLVSCGEQGGAATPSTPTTVVPAAAEGLVLRVEYTGGFISPQVLVSRLPIVSVYADGRVLSEGPVAAIYPGPALPNVQEQQIDQGAVQDLVDRALAAGVAETSDLGSPPVADAPNTRFTVVTASDTYVREIYALFETPLENSGLTADQEAARAKLSDFLATVTDPSGTQSHAYEADTVAAIASPWIDPEDGLEQPEVAWPGPALPGEPTGGPFEISCVIASGDQARAVLEAAGSANGATPWVTADGARWSVVLRPLLPDESGCADLTD
ncbi:hypothetical protein [Blastococcus sp. CT_GayMR16]|uniref:hypothetical protein n=1 Tax=Blastococcus sp. CT_GayMR16 TaxID=2559607 RepID=UPI0010748498|nr:hypothetical protein [Blastococcus sp. CT_GayMR16]TFV89134.1 hypothetical protein E4P38_08290 [Blastococcus sp. CT_GayMR16]